MPFCPTPPKTIRLLLFNISSVNVVPDTIKLLSMVVCPFKSVVPITNKLPLTVKSSTTIGKVPSFVTDDDNPVPVLKVDAIILIYI